MYVKKHPHTIDLKAHAVRPFVDKVRIWGLKHQAWATNTSDRLRWWPGPGNVRRPLPSR